MKLEIRESEIKDLNILSKKNEDKMTALLGKIFTLAETNFALPKFIKDEKGHIYQSGCAQAISWTQDNRDSFLPYYRRIDGMERRYRAGKDGGYLNAPQNNLGHWLSDTEYNAKVSLLCWLIERGYMTSDDVHERMKSGREKEDFKSNRKN